MKYHVAVTYASGKVTVFVHDNRMPAKDHYHDVKYDDPKPVRVTLHAVDGDIAYRLGDWQRDRNTSTTREVYTPQAEPR